MHFGLEDLVRSLGRGAVDQARTLVEMDAVVIVSSAGDRSDERVFAIVRPFDDRPVRVSVRVRPHEGRVELSGQCSCSAGRACVHVAAVLLDRLGEEALRPDRWTAAVENAGERPSVRRRAARRSRFDAAPRNLARRGLAAADTSLSRSNLREDHEQRVLRQWLDRVASAVRTDAGGPVAEGAEPRQRRAAAKHRLLYVLDRHAQSGRLTVHPLVAYVRKNGSFSAPKNCGYTGGPNRPGYVNIEDRELLPAILTFAAGWNQHSFFSPVEIDEPAVPRLVPRLLETSRCHWQDANGPLLGAGRLRAAALEWQLDAEGLQHPRLAIRDSPQAVALAGDPPWYVDPDAGVAGPLDLDLDLHIAGALLNAPALPPDAAGTARQRLERLAAASGARIPLPRPVEIEERSPTPVPHLRLTVHRPSPDPYARYRPAGPIPMAQLSFEYDGVRVAAEASDGLLQHIVDGRLVRMRRDADVEEAAAELLENMGLCYLADVDVRDAPPGAFVPLVEPEQVDDFMIAFSRQAAARLDEAGWVVEFDDDYPYRVVEGDDVEWYAGVAEGTNAWFDLELGIEIDGERHSLLEILVQILHDPRFDAQEWNDPASVEGRSLVVRLRDGRMLVLPDERVRVILGTLTELFGEKPLTAAGALRMSPLNAPRLEELDEALGAGTLTWSGGRATRELGRKLRGFRGVRQVAVPRSFRGKLRPYQRQGLNWMQFLREHELAGVLADDMGLGKTVQVLAHLLVEERAGRADLPSLVVAPTSVIANWRREAERFAPSLRVLTLQGPSRKQHFDRFASHDLVLTTYPLLSRDQDVLTAQPFHALVLDEAQFVKNAKTKTSQVTCRIQARHRLCLTGTPMENHLGELWALFRILLPGLLGDARQFRRLFRTPIEKYDDRRRREQLAARVQPFLLRRTKDEVATELPPKTEMTRTVDLGPAQRDLYESIRLAMNEKVRREVARKGLERSTIIILDALLKLRQVCCDPRLLKVEQAKHVRERAKLDVLLDMLDEMLREGRRVLLFSQFTSMLKLIERELSARELSWVKITGQTRDRDTPVRRFQAGEVPLFLISLKAGGTGLNLTAADTVIHFDPWWNPAVEDQATDRAHRIGQDKPVFVYRLIVAGSVEEKMLALQVRKRELAEGIYGTGRGRAAAALSARDLDVLFQPLDLPGSTALKPSAR